MQHPSLESWGNADGDNGAGDKGFMLDGVSGGLFSDVDMHSPRAQGPSTHVVLLTGIDRLTLDAVSFSLADSCPFTCVVTYDVAADDDCESGVAIARTIRRPASFDEVLPGDVEAFPMEGCCITCSVKRDLAGVVRGVGPVPDMVLAVLPIGVEGIAVAQYLADCSMLGELPCDVEAVTVATAVGLDDVEARLFDDDQLVLAGSGDEAVLDPRSTGVVQARLIREAGHVLMLPMLSDDCLTLDGRGARAEVDRVRALVRALADADAVVHDDAHRVDMHALFGVLSVAEAKGLR